MIFNVANISFFTRMGAACSQFEIHDSVMDVTLSGPSRYTYLKLNEEQTQTVNAQAKMVGIEHERGPERNKFMVYSGIFLPGQVKVLDNSCEATTEEKSVFGKIFNTAAAAIATHLGWSVNSEDVMRIELEKTVDFSFREARRACSLSIELSQSAADRLNMDRNSRFREYDQGPHNEISMVIYPGQKR